MTKLLPIEVQGLNYYFYESLTLKRVFGTLGWILKSKVNTLELEVCACGTKL